jgi:MFS transporter, DHA1 family, multidrug resistance protein
MPPNPTAQSGPSLEFVVIIALMTAITAFAIDAMLPALPAIAADLGASGNDQQLIVAVLFLGTAFGQLIYGPVSDSYGRRSPALIGFAIFIFGCVVSLVARDFTTMLAGRFLQGLGAAGPRIISIAIVRDRYEGRAMASVMSLTMTLFILIPVVAPSIGQAIVSYGSWHLIFAALLGLVALTLAWFALRMDESLPKERRMPLSLGRVLTAFAEVAGNRRVAGPALGAGFVVGGLIAYLSSAQQILGELYGLGDRFPLVFGSLAAFVGVASLINSWLVMKFGIRRLCYGALLAFIGAAAVYLVLVIIGGGVPSLAITYVWLAITFSAFGLLFGNMNALAMEPVGHIAGSAAALIGSFTTFQSAAIGVVIARSFDGTMLPMAAGFLLLGLAALGCLAWSDTRP